MQIVCVIIDYKCASRQFTFINIWLLLPLANLNADFEFCAIVLNKV